MEVSVYGGFLCVSILVTLLCRKMLRKICCKPKCYVPLPEMGRFYLYVGEQQIDLWIGGLHIMLIIATKAMICEESVRTQEKYI